MKSTGRMPELARRVSILLIVSAVLAVLMVVAGVVAWLHLDGAGDAYTRALIAVGEEPDDVPRQVGLALGFDVVTAGVLCVVTGFLARMLRYPLPWARVTTWVVAAVAWAALGCGLAAPPELWTWADGVMPLEVQRSRGDLLLGWYPGVHSVLVLVVLAALTVAAVLLLRTPAQEFYRATSRETAPDWGVFGRDRG